MSENEQINFLVDALIKDDIYIVSCDEETTVVEFGRKALTEYNRINETPEGERAPRLRYVRDNRGRILSGGLYVSDLDYEGGLECSLIEISPSKLDKGNENDSSSPTSIVEAMSTFYRGQQGVAESIVTHLGALVRAAIASANPNPTVNPSPEGVELLSQLVKLDAPSIRTPTMKSLEILCNSSLLEARRFLFRDTLVGFAVGALHEIVRNTADGDVCVSALKMLQQHLITYIELNTIAPEDLLTTGRHSRASHALSGRPGARERANLNILRNQVASGGGPRKVPFQMDMSALQEDVEAAVIRFPSTKIQGEILEMGEGMVSLAMNSGLVESPYDAVLKQEVVPADWENRLGLPNAGAPTSFGGGAGGKSRRMPTSTASAPNLRSNVYVPSSGDHNRQRDGPEKLEAHSEADEHYDVEGEGYDEGEEHSLGSSEDHEAELDSGTDSGYDENEDPSDVGTMNSRQSSIVRGDINVAKAAERHRQGTLRQQQQQDDQQEQGQDDSHSEVSGVERRRGNRMRVAINAVQVSNLLQRGRRNRGSVQEQGKEKDMSTEQEEGQDDASDQGARHDHMSLRQAGQFVRNANRFRPSKNKSENNPGRQRTLRGTAQAVKAANRFRRRGNDSRDDGVEEGEDEGMGDEAVDHYNDWQPRPNGVQPSISLPQLHEKQDIAPLPRPRNQAFQPPSKALPGNPAFIAPSYPGFNIHPTLLRGPFSTTDAAAQANIAIEVDVNGDVTGAPLPGLLASPALERPARRGTNASDPNPVLVPSTQAQAESQVQRQGQNGRLSKASLKSTGSTGSGSAASAPSITVVDIEPSTSRRALLIDQARRLLDSPNNSPEKPRDDAVIHARRAESLSWAPLEAAAKGTTSSAARLTAGAGAHLPLARMKQYLTCNEPRLVNYALDRLLELLSTPAPPKAFIGPDAFELGLIVYALLRQAIATPTVSPEGSPPSGKLVAARAEVVARRVLGAAKTDLRRVHHCIICLRLLVDEDSDAVAQVLWHTLPRDLLKGHTSTATNSKPCCHLMLTLAHATEMTYKWRGLHSGGATVGAVSDGAAELAYMATHFAGWAGPDAVLHGDRTSSQPLHIEPLGLVSFLSSAHPTRHSVSSRIALSLSYLCNMLETLGANSPEFQSVVAYRDYAVLSWCLFHADHSSKGLVNSAEPNIWKIRFDEWRRHFLEEHTYDGESIHIHHHKYHRQNDPAAERVQQSHSTDPNPFPNHERLDPNLPPLYKPVTTMVDPKSISEHCHLCEHALTVVAAASVLPHARPLLIQAGAVKHLVHTIGILTRACLVVYSVLAEKHCHEELAQQEALKHIEVGGDDMASVSSLGTHVQGGVSVLGAAAGGGDGSSAVALGQPGGGMTPLTTERGGADGEDGSETARSGAVSARNKVKNVANSYLAMRKGSKLGSGLSAKEAALERERLTKLAEDARIQKEQEDKAAAVARMKELQAKAANSVKFWIDPAAVSTYAKSVGLCCKALANLCYIDQRRAVEVSTALITELNSQMHLRTRVPDGHEQQEQQLPETADSIGASQVPVPPAQPPQHHHHQHHHHHAYVFGSIWRPVLSDDTYKVAMQDSIKRMSVIDKSIPFYISFIDGEYQGKETAMPSP